ncbi:hypothetical protein T484DRAFT_1910081, partial [Baffinella frigidus]
MPRYVALLALLTFVHRCDGGGPSIAAGEGGAEDQRNLYDQVYASQVYGYAGHVVGDGGQEAGLMTNVLLCPALWGSWEGADPLHVLDAGAGRGAMVDWLRRRAPRSVEGFGVELSGVAVDSSPWPELKREGRLVNSSLDAIPFPDRHFDLVRLSCHDNPARPHLHIACHPRAWWDDLFSHAGCYPHLEALGYLWRGAEEPEFPWRPFDEPWVFAYSCGHGREAARAELAMMRHPSTPLGPSGSSSTQHRRTLELTSIHDSQLEDGGDGWAYYFGSHEYYHWTQDCATG